MDLTQFATEFSELPPGEQTQFAEVLRRLLAEGLLWREDEADKRYFHFVKRRQELLASYLDIAGWELVIDDRLNIAQVVHRDGAHRRRLTKDTTIWLLLLRLLYQEQEESRTPRLTKHPVTTIGELNARYNEFFPGKLVRKKASLDEALRTLAGLRLIRAATGGTLRASNTEQQLELLPTLELVIPSSGIISLHKQLSAYNSSRTAEDDED